MCDLQRILGKIRSFHLFKQMSKKPPNKQKTPQTPKLCSLGRLKIINVLCCHFKIHCLPLHLLFPFSTLRRLVLQKVGFENWECLLRKIGYGRTLHSCVRVRLQNSNFISETLPQLAFTNEAPCHFKTILLLCFYKEEADLILKVTSLRKIVPNKLQC